MREAKSYRCTYTQVRRTSAWEGPFRPPLAERVASVLLAVCMGLAGACMLFFWLSI